jgi:hypothetical protein
VRGVRVHLRPVDRDHPDLHQSRLPTEPQHLAEQARKRRLVANTKPRDRRVIRRLLRRDHPVGDILNTPALDPARGALTPRVGVEQQRHHHRRLKRRTAPSILAIGAIERREIHLLHRRQHEPRQMILRQPIPRIRRHQEHLLTITLKKVLGHTQKCLNRTGQTRGLRDTHDEEGAWGAVRRALPLRPAHAGASDLGPLGRARCVRVALGAPPLPLANVGVRTRLLWARGHRTKRQYAHPARW